MIAMLFMLWLGQDLLQDLSFLPTLTEKSALQQLEIKRLAARDLKSQLIELVKQEANKETAAQQAYQAKLTELRATTKCPKCNLDAEGRWVPEK